jgi:hypothetical protein
MCDTIPGELLVCFHRDDRAADDLIETIHNGRVSHVRVIEELGYRVTRAGLPMRTGLKFTFYKLGVPPGDEAFKINYLQFYYKWALLDALNTGRMSMSSHGHVLNASNHHFQVVPHSILSIRATAPAVASGIGFSFTQTHDAYRKMIGWQAGSATSPGKRVLILDTGLDPAITCKLVDQKNFVDDSKPADASDDNGHGTAVGSIVTDLCPSVELVIYKVADASGRASEWDTLAALAARSGADVINISLSFGLPDRICSHCGRESHSSRSAVFENMIDQLDELPDGPLMIAAAGNDGLSELSFPARFENVLAIESVNLASDLSEFTNRAATDHQGNNHRNVFVLPGGETTQNTTPTEFIGTSTSGSQFYGTSFSTAYASGLISALWSQPLHAAKDRPQLLDHLRTNADNSLPSYSYTTHGNGMMKLV